MSQAFSNLRLNLSVSHFIYRLNAYDSSVEPLALNALFKFLLGLAGTEN
jgi:hypothetical protein